MSSKIKKETKKERAIRIYAEYGIVSDGEKILAPWNEYIPELATFGTNTKVGKAATWAVYHGNETLTVDDFKAAMKIKTCRAMAAAGIAEIKGSCPCHCKNCYCDNGNYTYDSTKAALMTRLIIARYYPEFMKNAMIAQIKIYEYKQYRIHACGDFAIGPVYVDAWKAIITSCPECRFWTYTKYEYALNAFKDIPNLKIVPSNTPVGINFGTCAELLKMHKELTDMGYRVHICACGTVFEKHCADCEHGCKAVGIECDFVLFIKHSTKDYKAGKKDLADFIKVMELIAMQDN